MAAPHVFLVAIIVLGVLGVPGAANGQSGPEAVSHPAPTWVSLTSEEGCEFARTGYTCQRTFTDPRVNGIVAGTYQVDCFVSIGGERPCFASGVEESTGPAGSWRGSWWGTVEDGELATSYHTMIGTGGCEGFTFVWHGHGPFEARTGFGLVYEGDPPPELACYTSLAR